MPKEKLTDIFVRNVKPPASGKVDGSEFWEREGVFERHVIPLLGDDGQIRSE